MSQPTKAMDKLRYSLQLIEREVGDIVSEQDYAISQLSNALSDLLSSLAMYEDTTLTPYSEPRWKVEVKPDIQQAIDMLVYVEGKHNVHKVP